jgi:hypothetical protein
MTVGGHSAGFMERMREGGGGRLYFIFVEVTASRGTVRGCGVKWMISRGGGLADNLDVTKAWSHT